MTIALRSASIIAIGVFTALAFAATCVGEERNAALYVGTKTCGMCHKKDESGNQKAKWEASPHAKAFEKLGTPEAKEAAKKLGIADPQQSGKCLKCHATAYNGTEQSQTEKMKAEDGVGCESCHGPGKKYMSKQVMEDRQEAISAGLVYPASDSCKNCHNDQSPTWKPDRYTTKDGKKVGFDFEQAFEKIKHPDPLVKK